MNLNYSEMTSLFGGVASFLYIMNIKWNWLDYIVYIFNNVLNTIYMCGIFKLHGSFADTLN